MSEWWTYSPSDFLLFSPRTYYRLFELYNADIWPLQIVALALGAAIPLLLRGCGRTGAQGAAAVLVLAWCWVGLAFHVDRYASINWAAPWFGAAFAAQAGLLAWTGVVRRAFAGPPAGVAARGLGWFLLLYALLFHPFLPMLLGRAWSQAEVFGVTPAPTVLATLGVVLLTRCRGRTLLPIPAAWCAVEGASLWAMNAVEAVLLPTLGMLALLLHGLQGRAPASPGDARTRSGSARPP